MQDVVDDQARHRVVVMSCFQPSASILLPELL